MHEGGLQVGTCKYMIPSHTGSLTYSCVEALDHAEDDLLLKLKEQDVHAFITDARDEGGIILVHCMVSRASHCMRAVHSNSFKTRV
jgi:protein-tyrosine phosphatase